MVLALPYLLLSLCRFFLYAWQQTLILRMVKRKSPQTVNYKMLRYVQLTFLDLFFKINFTIYTIEKKMILDSLEYLLFGW